MDTGQLVGFLNIYLSDSLGLSCGRHLDCMGFSSCLIWFSNCDVWAQ